MDFDPKKFFIGVIDFFSVLLPGALFTYELMDDIGPQFLGERYKLLEGTAAWVAFLFGSYVFGHFIFLLGAAFLDRLLYDRIRNATTGREIERLADGKVPPSILTRFLARLLIKKESDEAQTRAIDIKKHYINPVGSNSGINTFQWSKARLVLENHAEAMATVLRFEADSKFFRSFAVVIFLLLVWKTSKQEYSFALGSIPFLGLALWRYIDQRLKATDQSYWYVITLEAANPSGYRQSPANETTQPSRAGGVVYRHKRGLMKFWGRSGTEYLIVQAREKPDEWVLPKGHVEPEERMECAAVREVHEETGIWARIEKKLRTISFDLPNERAEVRFYLMEAVARGKPQESRLLEWLPIDKAVDMITHQESKDLLRAADEVRGTAPSSAV